MKAFKRLNPKQKQLVVVGGALAAALAVITVAMSSQPTTNNYRSAESSIRHVLTDRDSREVTIDSLATQLSATQNQNQELTERFQRLQAEIRAGSESGIPAAMTRELDNLSRELDLIREENRLLREQTETLNLAAIVEMQEAQNQRYQEQSSERAPTPPPADVERDVERDVVNATPPATTASDPFGAPASRVDTDQVFQQRPVTRRAASGDAAGAEGEGEAAAPRLSITTFYQEDHPADQFEEAATPPVYLPSGSIISGVLLNGIDAPTSQGARRDPFPVSVRVKKDAILPNHYSANVKECFMLVSGHGDLSTERAFLRGNSISCITNSGDTIETELRGYIVGEDGKAGLRGRLVSKQGALIARSMVAGFFSGASQAFNVSPVPVLNTSSNNSGQQEYQRNYSPDLVEGAAAQGASQALDRVAQFYIDAAEQIFPVVEIDVGREVDLILTQGLNMSPIDIAAN